MIVGTIPASRHVEVAPSAAMIAGARAVDGRRYSGGGPVRGASPTTTTVRPSRRGRSRSSGFLGASAGSRDTKRSAAATSRSKGNPNSARIRS